MSNKKGLKGRCRWEKGGNVVNGGGLATTTYFVTEFEDKWEARDLYHEFKELGNIDEMHSKQEIQMGEEVRVRSVHQCVRREVVRDEAG